MHGVVVARDKGVVRLGCSESALVFVDQQVRIFEREDHRHLGLYGWFISIFSRYKPDFNVEPWLVHYVVSQFVKGAIEVEVFRA